MGRDALMEALNDAFVFGQRHYVRMQNGDMSIDVDAGLKQIKERYFM